MFKINEFRDTVANFINYWDSYIGLSLIMMIFSLGYWGVASDKLNSTFPQKEVFFNGILPFSLLLIIFLVWSFKSNRWNLYKRKTLTTGLFIKCGDFTSQSKIRRLIREMIDEIQTDFPDLKLKLYPVDFIKNENDLKKYLDKNHHVIDNALLAVVKYGNCTEDSKTFEKIEITELKFVGRFDEENYQNYRVQINVSQDLHLRNLNKDWIYLESKSFDDRDKIKYNLRDSLLFFMGLYLIYKEELDVALQIFKSLRKVEENISLVNEILNRKRERLDEILLNIFTVNALRKYTLNNDISTAYKLLKECEIIFVGNHKFYYANCILLSRICYEKNEIEDAYKYTERAEALLPGSTPIYCNKGFFGMIENNIENVYENYKELAHVYKHKEKVNFVDVIEFLLKYKARYPESEFLFDFCIGMLNFFYADKELGRKTLNELKNKINDSAKYVKILGLTEHFLTQGSIKSPYYQRNLKAKSTKKKKRKK